MSNIASNLIAVACAALAGGTLYRGWMLRQRRQKPPCIVSGYKLPPGESITVSACACPRCKNVIWAQNTHISPPAFCAYCGYKFEGYRIADDGEMESLIVTDP